MHVGVEKPVAYQNMSFLAPKLSDPYFKTTYYQIYDDYSIMWMINKVQTSLDVTVN